MLHKQNVKLKKKKKKEVCIEQWFKNRDTNPSLVYRYSPII